MVNCDFCGNEIKNIKTSKKETRLNDGNYCEECSTKGIEDLYTEILEEDDDDEGEDKEEENLKSDY